MKKFFVYFILSCLFFSSGMCVFADIPLKITKKDKNYGLIDETDNKIIFPEIYSGIKKYKRGDSYIYVASSPYYKAFWSKEGIFDDFIKNYSNMSENLKFVNYPKNGAIIYPAKKENKILYGIIFVHDSILYNTDAVFSEIIYPDSNSFISKKMNITFAPADKIFVRPFYFNGYIVLADYMNGGIKQKIPDSKLILSKFGLNEKIYVKDNIVYSEYGNFEFPKENYFMVKNTDTKLKITLSDDFKQGYVNIKTAYELYDLIEKTYNVKLENYPEKFALFSDTSAEIIDGETVKELRYRKFNPGCINSFLYKTTGLKISFETEFPAEKEGKYGLLNKSGQEILPFKFNNLFPAVCKYDEFFTFDENEKKLKSVLLEVENYSGNYYISSVENFNKERAMREITDYFIDSGNNIVMKLYNTSAPYNGIYAETLSKNADLYKADQNRDNRKQFMKDLPVNLLYTAIGILYLPIFLMIPEIDITKPLAKIQVSK